jgi:hypothetical protein
MRAIHTIIPTLFEGHRPAGAAPAASDSGDRVTLAVESRRQWRLRPIPPARRTRFTVRQWPAAR